jgi:hypothetical protein
MEGIAGVQARIQDIISRFEGPPAKTGGDSNTDFASVLAQAQAPSGTGSSASTSLTTPGTLNRAGVDPVQWAKDFLTRLGAPITSANVQAITAWEQAEGTKAAYNPLATTQSGFAGETRFNSVGVKNYAAYQDGIDANAHALMNGRYQNILDALHAGNSADAVAQAIANSPWGTHEGVLRVLESQH